MPKLKVLLIGPYPPPYGGLAVQILEWQRYLARMGSCECVVMNIGESRTAEIDGCLSVKGTRDFAAQVSRFARQGYLIHLVTNGHNFKSWLCSLFCALAGAGHGRRTILVFGSGNAPDYIANAGPAVRLLIRTAVMLGGRLICRNERTKRALIEVGAAPRKIAIVPGFLGVSALPETPLPEDIESFLKTHTPVLGATANLDPEYGVPLMLDAVHALRKTYPRIGLLVMGPGREADGRFEGLARVRTQALFTGPLPHETALGVMRRLSVFLRPTYFDGDSNSVREALALGVPVVASDTDFRPEGVLRFRKGDAADLIHKVHETLSHGERWQPAPAAAPDSAARLVGLYRELVSEPE